MNKPILDAQKLFSKGFLLNDMIEGRLVNQFIKRFRENFLSVNLIRIGNGGDGSYLIPDILTKISCCFSPGVCETIDFEKQLSEDYGIKSFMIDASIGVLPFQDSNFTFERKFLGTRDEDNTITLNSWIGKHTKKEDNNLLLQMDIETSEYDVLAYESIETLKRFSCMVIEFHWFDQIFHPFFFKMVSGIFEKIFKEFSICHVHPNNCCGIASFDGVDIPRVFEVTFIRNDMVEEVKSNNIVTLPHNLDIDNAKHRPTIEMPSAWWQKVNI